MKRIYTVAMLAFCIGLAAVPSLGKEKDKGKKESTPAPAMDKPAETGMMPGMEEMMKKWETHATPGEHHKFLEGFCGTWDYTMKWFMGGPDMPPDGNRGTSVTKAALGGRFIVTEANGQMMGMPFIGNGCMGYDNFKKKFTATWMDNTSTGLYTMEGSYGDPDHKSLVFYGPMDDIMTGEHDKVAKYFYRMVDKDTIVFEVWDMLSGETGKQIGEITYKRKS